MANMAQEKKVSFNCFNCDAPVVIFVPAIEAEFIGNGAGCCCNACAQIAQAYWQIVDSYGELV